MVLNKMLFFIHLLIHYQIIDPVILFFITIILYVVAYILAAIENNRKTKKGKNK